MFVLEGDAKFHLPTTAVMTGAEGKPIGSTSGDVPFTHAASNKLSLSTEDLEYRIVIMLVVTSVSIPFSSLFAIGSTPTASPGCTEILSQGHLE